MEEKKEDMSIKRMAELLQQGSTLTELSCPACSSPLFRLKDGTLWCAKDEKKVIIVKEGEEPPTQQATTTQYDKLEAILQTKINGIQAKIEKTENVEELQKLASALSDLLSSLEKVKEIKKA